MINDRAGRRLAALYRRVAASHTSTALAFPEQTANTDQDSPYIFNFTKGLVHTEKGLLADPGDYETFRNATDSGDPQDFQSVPLNASPDGQTAPNVSATVPDALKGMAGMDRIFRQYESPTGGFAHVLQGPDSFALVMPPAPEAGGPELAAEMAEVYQMALHRDLPVAAFMDETLVTALTSETGVDVGAEHAEVVDDAANLSKLAWFRDAPAAQTELTSRRRAGQTQTPGNLYRGVGEDPWPTPFVSQFMLMGTGLGGDADPAADADARRNGQIDFGNQRIDQSVKVAQPARDYMTNWADWRDVQNGYNAREALAARAATGQAEPEFTGAYRPITTLRDLATYVHDDALYQAYLNAALILLGRGAGIDPGIPYHKQATLAQFSHNQEPFAVFGGPHLLTLVTEASSRALRAVRLQKFSVHRRTRPEGLAALYHTALSGYRPDGVNAFDDANNIEAEARSQIAASIAPDVLPPPAVSEGFYRILERVRVHNAAQNGDDGLGAHASWLLPMAFPEGSPMHPAYGAGHATVAGACVTMLKAFFAMEEANGTPTYLVPPGGQALVPDPGGNPPTLLTMPQGLTLLGELN